MPHRPMGWLPVLGFLLLLAGLAPVSGQIPPAAPFESFRLGPDLQQLVRRQGPGAAQAETVQYGLPADRILWDAQGRVGVQVTARNPGALLSALRTLGMQVTAVDQDRHFLEGFLPVNALQAAAGLAPQGLLGITAIGRPGLSTGSVRSEADFVQQSDRARALTGVDGAGVRVGVISDSFNRLGGAAAGMASGDLPNDPNLVLLEDPYAGPIDEGRAMAELIHDVAPGAELRFASGLGGPASLAAAIRMLADPSQGNCKIVVDDLYYAEPMFQDSVISEAIDEVVTTRGVSYFSAAGNLADQAYESTKFDEQNIPGLNWICHDFDPGPAFEGWQELTLGPGQRIDLVLQWDDPFYTTTGVDTDLDLILRNPTGTFVAAANSDNVASQVPQESFSYQNPTNSTLTYLLFIRHMKGPAPGRIRWVNYGANNFGPIQIGHATHSSTLIGHSMAMHGMSVGAVNWFDQTNPASFTSKGQATLLFQSNGQPLSSPEVRQKPDVAGIQGTDTTFFGGDFDGSGSPNFFGTSAAAPHVAAVAALLLQKYPGLSPGLVYQVLKQTAIDIGSPGYDPLCGHGLVDAFNVLIGGATPANALPFADAFSGGALGTAYETHATGAGHIQILAGRGAVPDYFLLLDSALDGTPSRNEVILHVNATNLAALSLSFKHREFADEDHPMSPDFYGSEDSDGVALSVDGGLHWFRLLSLTGANSTGTFSTSTFDLKQFTAQNGLKLSADTQIKFQQYDDEGSPSDGIAFDDLQFTGSFNHAPLAGDDAYSINEDQTLHVPIPGVLGNDSDPDGDPITAMVVTEPQHGTLSLAPSGTFTYAPDADYSGTDSFRYEVSDGQAASDTGLVTITVSGLNDRPVGHDDVYTTAEDTPLGVAAPGVLANDTDADGDSITASLLSGPSHGTLSFHEDGRFLYTPFAEFQGQDSFVYEPHDGTSVGFPATVTLNVTSVNDPPTAFNESYTTRRGTLLNVAAPGVLANDSDPEGNPLTPVIASTPNHGSLLLNANGSFTYQPEIGFSGLDSFLYRASDGAGQSGLATVSITVSAEPPGSTPNAKVSGSGTLAGVAGSAVRPAPQAKFTLSAAVKANGKISGSLVYTDPVPSRRFKSASFTSVVVIGNRARIIGTGKGTAGQTVYFVLDVSDVATPGDGKDRFALEVSTGITVPATVVARGNVKVGK